jgi:peptidoglycan/xylan/chitin deacetylase (PgdA/CDA1 family)
VSVLRILMYHAIGEPGEPAARFVVPIRAFERQMAWLARLRFSVVALDSAVRGLLAGEPPPPRAVALTFDDGTRDNHTLALPVLRRYGFPATAFVVTSRMGESVSWTEHAGLGGRPIMTWDEALALEPLVSLEPHTRTHPSLPALDDEELAREVRGSREDLEARTGRPHLIFAYPYGHYDQRVETAVANAGFIAALSVTRGASDSSTAPYALKRLEIGGDDPSWRFLRTICLDGPSTLIAKAFTRRKG